MKKRTQDSMMMLPFPVLWLPKSWYHSLFFKQNSNFMPLMLIIQNSDQPSSLLFGAGILRSTRCIWVQERMLESFVSCYALGRIELETKRHKLYGFFFLVGKWKVGLTTFSAPQQNLLPAVAVLADGRNVRLEDLAVQQSGLVHATLAKDTAKLDEGVNVVGRMEERKAATEESKEDDAATPDIDNASLRSTFQQNFRSTEASGAGTVGSARISRVFLGI